MIFLLFGILAQQPRPFLHHLHPWPDIFLTAMEEWAEYLNLQSDSPAAVAHWSQTVIGPCPSSLNSGGGDAWEPCSILPDWTQLHPMPAVLYQHSQTLRYTAPNDHDPKAVLTLSSQHRLMGAGVIWETTVTSEGLSQDILWCRYKRIRKTIWLGLPIRVTILRPQVYYHLRVDPNNDFSLTEHRIQQWNLPFQFLIQQAAWQPLPQASACGTVALRYTTLAGDALNQTLQGLHSDAAPLGNTEQVVTTAAPAAGDCGQFPYAVFAQFMTHRLPNTPTVGIDGPPLEVWSFGDTRSLRHETDQVTHGQTSNHSRVEDTAEQLERAGLQGKFQKEPLLMEGQLQLADGRRRIDPPDRAASAQALLDLLQAAPGNPALDTLVTQQILPFLQTADRADNSHIRFDPSQHCTPGQEGIVPFYGAHFLGENTPNPCGFCDYHDLIVRDPLRSWTHTRTVGLRWLWRGIQDDRAQLYKHAWHFIHRVLWSEPSARGVNDRQKQLAQEIGDGPRVSDLEAQAGDTTSNRTHTSDRSDIPGIFQRNAGFDPCSDPSQTIQYLLLYQEIEDIFAAPCGLLWAVSF